MQQKAKKTISHVTPVRPLTDEEKKERDIRAIVRIADDLLDNLCRLFLDPCREGCPLRKTREEVEANKKNRN